MKIFDVRTLQDQAVISNDDLNLTNQQIAEFYNSNVGQDNLPINEITRDRLPIRTGGTGESRGIFSTYFETYAHGSDYTSPLLTTNLAGYNSDASWISLEEIPISGSSLTMSNQTGILRGDFVVDYEFRYGYDGPGFTVVDGTTRWVDFAIFLDGRFIRNVGKSYARRFTYSVPFACGITTGEHTLDIRFRYSAPPVSNILNSELGMNFQIYSIGMGVKNWFR